MKQPKDKIPCGHLGNHTFKGHLLMGENSHYVINTMQKKKKKKPKTIYFGTYGDPNSSFWSNDHFADECRRKPSLSVQNHEFIDASGSLVLEVKNHGLVVKQSGLRRPSF